MVTTRSHIHAFYVVALVRFQRSFNQPHGQCQMDRAIPGTIMATCSRTVQRLYVHARQPAGGSGWAGGVGGIRL